MRVTVDKLECPVGEKQCAIIDELQACRALSGELQHLVRHDQLTGLYNYRHFSEVLSHEMERTRRFALPISLIMIDLDHFKRINDSHGHQIGNQVLQRAAQIVLDSTRRVDTVCRYGGEEFVIILPGTPLIMAVKVAERIRAGFADALVIPPENSETVTASLGVNTFSAEHTILEEEFVEQTDALLYQAKRAGRNCVRFGDDKRDEMDVAVSIEEKMALSDSQRPTRDTE